jgi:hypothetical protein
MGRKSREQGIGKEPEASGEQAEVFFLSLDRGQAAGSSGHFVDGY